MVPKRLLSLFTETELELLISGVPTIDVDALAKAAHYRDYDPASDQQIAWLWQALRTFDQTNLAKFVQFIIGTSKVPLGEWRFTILKVHGSTDMLPTSNTW